MKLLYLLIACSLVLLWRNNSILSWKYKNLTNKTAAKVMMRRVLHKPLYEYVNDPMELNSFAQMSQENKIAADALKFEASRRNCTFYAAIIVIFIAPRVILNFAAIPSTQTEAVTLFLYLLSVVVVYVFWTRWLFTTFDRAGKLHLFSAASIANFFVSVFVTVGWHLIANSLYSN